MNATLSIERDFLALAERISAGLGTPRLRALHLSSGEPSPPREPAFCALELDDGSVGLSFVLPDDRSRLAQASQSLKDVHGRDALSLAEGYLGEDPVARTLGFAAINALCQRLFVRARWIPKAAGDSLGQLAPKAGEHIGMIGLFPRLVARVSEAGAKLTVLELRAELEGRREGYRVTLDPSDLATCDKVLSTCTVLLNGSLNAVLEACRGSHLAIVGPTAGCVPDLLFERGVDTVGGTRVVDLEGFRKAFREGAPWGRSVEKYAIARQDYPGVDWLLARVA